MAIDLVKEYFDNFNMKDKIMEFAYFKRNSRACCESSWNDRRKNCENSFIL